MINIFKKFTILAVGLLAPLMLIMPANVLALDCANPQTPQEQLQCGACHGSGINDTACASAPDNSTSSLNNTIKSVVNIISVVAGIVAVLMLVVGGFRYITSSGNDQEVATAKKTILYALGGLVVIAMAQVVVKFVLTKATKT